MKAVLISIQPKWVEKIASWQKTIEVRKTAPKCEVPFKCYIYCTKAKEDKYILERHDYETGKISRMDGKVIGEFVCDNIIEWQYDHDHKYYVDYPDDCTSYFPYLKCHNEATGLKCSELEKYGKSKPLYGWHISDLKIYDKPKELSEFKRPCSYKGTCYYCDRASFENDGTRICDSKINRAPQSWQYVEDWTVKNQERLLNHQYGVAPSRRKRSNNNAKKSD